MGKIQDLIKKEEKRQKETLMMIPSENITYPEVLKAVGSVLMQKYAEGYPSKRYYQGNKVVDEVESYCQRLALEVFGLKSIDYFVNVQPHSGCEANLSVINALLEPGDKILSMFLPDGGHLSHGWHSETKKISIVSKFYNVEFYHVEKDTKLFDYKNIETQALKFKPKLIISGGTAYPRTIDHKKMAGIAKKVGAYYLSDIAHEAGLIAGKAFPSPFPFADVVTMTTHKTLRGPRGAIIIGRKDLKDKINFGVFPGLQGGPHLHTIAGIAIALEKAKTKSFQKYAKQVVLNAQALASELIHFGFDVVTGGTDKHLVLIDLRNKGLNGADVAKVLEEKAKIICNKNTVPNDTGSPVKPSGIRLGTPALTVLGYKESDMIKIAKIINEVCEKIKN